MSVPIWRNLPPGRDLDREVAAALGWQINAMLVGVTGQRYCIIPPDVQWPEYKTTHYPTVDEAWETLPHYSTIDEHAELLLEDRQFNSLWGYVLNHDMNNLSDVGLSSIFRTFEDRLAVIGYLDVGFRAAAICYTYLLYRNRG
jgi:hypothetical protein